MPKLLSTAAAVGVIALVAGAAYWAGKSSAPSPASGPAAAAPAGAGKGPPGVIVEASRVAVVRLPQALTAVGSLRSDEAVVLRPEVAGRVAEIGFREGEQVAKGQ